MSNSRSKKTAAPELDDKTIDDALQSLLLRYPDGVDLDRARTLLPPPYRASKKRIEDRIRALVGAGKIHRWGRTIGPEPYLARGRLRLLETLTGAPKTVKQIQGGLPESLRMRGGVKKIVDAAVLENVVFEHPDPKGKGAARYACVAADAKTYVAKIQKLIDATAKRLKRSGIDRDALVGALGALREEPAHSDTLLRAVLEVRPDARAHVLVSVRDLRRHLRWPKREFDRTVLELARDGRITLHHHDHPAGLSATEREDLVRDDRGNFFVGLVLEEAA